MDYIENEKVRGQNIRFEKLLILQIPQGTDFKNHTRKESNVAFAH